MSDIYYYITIHLGYGSHISPEFEALVSNISLFAYVKIGHSQSKVAIAVASLLIYFELKCDYEGFIAFVEIFKAKLGNYLALCYLDIAETRTFFLKHINILSQDQVFLKRVTQLRPSLSFV